MNYLIYFTNCLQLVIGNILQTRRHKVIFVNPENSFELSLNREQILSGLEIEDLIVTSIVQQHSEFISNSKY